MSYPINYPTPQGANVQIFSELDTTSDWVKPQGASFVWFTLIGGGGGGTSSGIGGGSSAVVNCLIPAFLIPDVLNVIVGIGGLGVSSTSGSASFIRYQQKDGSGYVLLSVNGGGSGSGGGIPGAVSTSNFFSAAGFYQSVAGQIGALADTSNGASTTTFLSGGSGGNSVTGAGQDSTANYGYSAKGGAAGASNPGGNGAFMLSPIIVGLGGAGGAGAGGGAGAALRGRGRRSARRDHRRADRAVAGRGEVANGAAVSHLRRPHRGGCGNVYPAL